MNASADQGKRLLSAPSALLSVDLRAGERLHLWVGLIEEGAGLVTVSRDGNRIGDWRLGEPGVWTFIDIGTEEAGRLDIIAEGQPAEISAAYAFDPTRVMRDGVRLLHVHPRTAAPDVPDGYHFRQPFGWMNDPNGWSRFGGHFHLFYQHFPHIPRWNTMHWGHAVSDDMLRWRHLPVFLRPDPALFPVDDLSGGAYSGSAIATPDGLRAFFTERRAGREPEDQIQLTALSRDGWSAEPPRVVLPLRPDLPGLTKDFRDPYVFTGPDGRLKMLLGSRDALGGVVLLYETDDRAGVTGWRFRDVLHRQTRNPQSVCECPCMVRLGPDDWALIYGMLSSTDPATGRRNLSSVVLGSFDGQRLTPRHEQELDFGSDAYAFQAMPTEDGIVGIAWLSNWATVNKRQDNPTAMTLPRRMLLTDGILHTPPIDGVATLRRQMLDVEALAGGSAMPLPGGAAEIEITLTHPGAAMRLDLQHPDLPLGIEVSAEGIEILHDPPGEGRIRYLAAGAAPRTLRLFIDTGSIEVFADGGRWTGTKRIAGFAPVTSTRIAAGRENVAGLVAYGLGL
ncbi:MAG: hypothetical protein KDK24_11160 [Pseudooceanicola sp.]|nr:hypothetical protein [Pseudooceanicola sp.]